MYQKYDQIVSSIELLFTNNGKSLTQLYSLKQSARELKSYLIESGVAYSPIVAAKWLIEIKPTVSHPVYKQKRYPQYLIAREFDSNSSFKELFYLDIQSNFDRLPIWASTVVQSFIEYSKLKRSCIEGYKHSVSTFLLNAIDKLEIKTTKSISCEFVINYRIKRNQERGLNEFLYFLFKNQLIKPYVNECYNGFICKTIIYKSEIKVPLINCGNKYSIMEYYNAHKKLIKDLREIGFSISVIKSFNFVCEEFGIFLAINNFHYSKTLVEEYVKCYEKKYKKLTTKRRGLLLIETYLQGGKYLDAMRLFPRPENIRLFPKWFISYADLYNDYRRANHIGKSALSMDKSALLQFSCFLDSVGCKNITDITANLVKAFNIEDSHLTAEGKNAYIIKIRLFLKFLEFNNYINSFSMALRSVSTICNRPTISLNEIAYRQILNYCTEKEKQQSYVESAILKTALQTGLRASDIVNLKASNINWNQMIFSLIQVKTRTHLNIPFTVDVGNAIWNYIKYNRPKVKSEYIFIKKEAPFTPLRAKTCAYYLNKSTEGSISKFHILRKTFSTRMLLNGSSISNISDALGHSSNGTVDSYLDIDIDQMKKCSLDIIAIPYIGGALCQ